MGRKDSGSPSVFDRLEELERQNRKLKGIGIFALLVVAGILLMGQTAPENRIVRAQEFQLIDSNGKVMGRMRVDGGSPQIQLFNQNGAETVSLYSYDNGNTGELLLSDIKAGTNSKTSATSIVMTKLGKRIWQAP